MTKPTDLPRFAEDDVVDSTTLLNNVAEPPESVKDSGWVPAFMEPSRRYMNWLHRITYLWCKWANESGTPFLHGTESAQVSDIYFDTQQNFSIQWTKLADMVTLHFPEVIAAGEGTSSSLIINPATTWDSKILPVTAIGPIKQPFQSGHGVAMVYRRGEIRIQTGASDTWLIYSPNDVGDLDFTNFPETANNRGWQAQSISYLAEDPLN